MTSFSSKDDSSSWKESLRNPFPWWKLTGMSILRPTMTKAHYVKLDEIENTLAGDDTNNDTVNLTKLRELCLTRGGLVSHSLRKRAWPKLVGAHQSVLLLQHDTNNDDTCATSLLEVTQQDMRLLQEDVARPTVWNIEDYVWQRRKEEEQKEKKVTFVPGLTAASPTGSFVALSTATEQQDESETTSPITVTPTSTMYSTTTTTTTHTIKATLRSTEEQVALTNTTVGLLRTRPLFSQQQQSGQERFHYYCGLHDLASLLLINLESPSLTCLMLQQLANYSLQDYVMMQQEPPRSTTSLHSTVGVVSRHLFLQVDSTLYQHLQNVLDTDTTDVVSKIYLKWIPSWFVSTLSNESLASRLVDVLLVSHATMPIYIAVALTCRYRFLLLDTTCTETMQHLLRNLPKRLQREEDAMNVLEQVIAMSIEYIRMYPPQTLVSTTLNNTNSMITVSPPTWAIACHAPTDWALLQQAKALRMTTGGADQNETTSLASTNDYSTTTTTTTISSMSFLERRKYPLSIAAMGLSGMSPRRTKRRRQWAWLVAVVLVLTAAGIAALSFQQDFHHAQGSFVSNDSSLPDSKNSRFVPWKLRISTSSKGASSTSNNNNKSRKKASSRRVVDTPSFQATAASPTPTPVSRPTAKSRGVKNLFNKVKDWKRNRLNRQEVARLASIVIMESSYYRWKGQRFLI